jgi:hypothetical protein
MRKVLFLLFALAVLTFSPRSSAQVAPWQGVGSVQFFSNTGVPLTSGVLYVYQAGTTTQVASYTDYTGTIQNPNPVPFSSGARATIWLTIGSYYKLVLCAQNDGAFCSPGDVLYSVDQVPGGTSGSSGGGGTFTGIFVSGSATPATAGTLRLASSDIVCWRNAAGTTNLCFRKNANDLLTWDGSSFGFSEITSIAAQCAVGIDLQWADNAAHRWMMCNNGGGPVQFVASGVDINTSDQVVQQHFGSTALPNCGTVPAAGQVLFVNVTCIGGETSPITPVVDVDLTAQAANIAATTILTTTASGFYRLNTWEVLTQAATTSSTVPTVQVVFTDADSSTRWTLSTCEGFSVNAVGLSFCTDIRSTSQSTGTTPSPVTFYAKTGTTIQYQTIGYASTGATPMQYALHVRLEGPF